MGLLSELARGVFRGADRVAEFTTKRGHRTFFRNRGARRTGVLLSSGKFITYREMVPEFVVPSLQGFRLKPYVSYCASKGTEAPMTAKRLFDEVVAPQIEKDVKDKTFDPNHLEKYGFEPTQDGKLFQLHPKNYVR
ncbi:39S ribosomal protein L41, mitochondrial [Erpetoichthys calabaricus]|uniref:Mitochondrial ribosomal protein L41 n=1 Tax=Erpetoichthys calabaricus TaxID=27687 RepID=A0A8C4T7Z1_ERPCA|nr:39S ribosomal protein L41, mitochondrial [Erpetoichthys calabaricus]